MPDIDILIEAEGWESIPEIEAVVERAAKAALQGAVIAPDATLSVLLADNATVQGLNAQFRGKDKPTNVLSFPAAPMPGQDEQVLGDIALAFETCRAEAHDEGKRLADHVTHLVIHGVLHLLGYDHETDADAEAMESRETALLAGFGIDNPYGERPEPEAGPMSEIRP